jgi:EpsD family peptidyl-prolyl cis-trans isomerase
MHYKPNSLAASRTTLRVAVVCMTVMACWLAGCGEHRKDKGGSQTAAKVNKEEITVHQINFVLQQQRNLRPEQADTAGKQVLERLIDQQLAVQKAEELKLDRDARVLQQIDAARREIVARAYVEKVGESAAKPTPEEAKRYYDEKPALFKERRIYNLQELAIEARPDQVETLRSRLQSAKNIDDFVEYLKANDYRFGGNQAVRAAEQLPLNSVDAFAKLKDGQALFNATPTGAQVVVVVSARSQPVDFDRARPMIEQYLLNERKRRMVEEDLKALRSGAKIEYVGKFAEGAPSTATASAGEPPIAPAVAVSAAVTAASAPPSTDADAINKGLSGLKK